MKSTIGIIEGKRDLFGQVMLLLVVGMIGWEEVDLYSIMSSYAKE